MISISNKIKFLNSLKVKYAILAGTPLHTNIGDRAIAYAETMFIKDAFPFMPIVEMPYGTDLSLLPAPSEKAVIFLHGGGNLGDIWENEELYRQELLKYFYGNKVLLFPQTIFFQDEKNMHNSIDVYSKHKDFTLVLREKISFNIARDNYKNPCILTPDIVMSLQGANAPSERRLGLLLVLRDDKEVVTSSDDSIAIKEFAENNFRDYYIYSDMHLLDDESALKRSHKSITLEKLNQFSRSRLVITDRLHGMVFALITGTPCIVLDSMTHKTRGVHEWIKGAGYDSFIKLIDNASQINEAVEEIDLDIQHSYSPSAFQESWEEIIKVVK